MISLRRNLSVSCLDVHEEYYIHFIDKNNSLFTGYVIGTHEQQMMHTTVGLLNPWFPRTPHP